MYLIIWSFLSLAQVGCLVSFLLVLGVPVLCWKQDTGTITIVPQDRIIGLQAWAGQVTKPWGHHQSLSLLSLEANKGRRVHLEALKKYLYPFRTKLFAVCWRYSKGSIWSSSVLSVPIKHYSLSSMRWGLRAEEIDASPPSSCWWTGAACISLEGEQCRGQALT